MFWPAGTGGGGWCWRRTRPRGARACALVCPAPRRRRWCSGLIVRDAEPAADAQALDRLALWALQRYAPIVAADPPDGLVIDTTGAAHLHGGEDAMVRGWSSGLPHPASPRGQRSPIAGAPPMPSPAYGAAVDRHPRRETARRPFSTCRSPPFVCPKTWWRPSRPRLRAHRRTGGKTPRAA